MPVDQQKLGDKKAKEYDSSEVIKYNRNDDVSDEEEEEEEDDREEEDDANLNTFSNYFNSLNESNYAGQQENRQQQQQSTDNVSDFIGNFYNKQTNTIFALPNYINTEDVVLKMRDFMQRYKINQCDIGDRIIGVKKSHVSFLLSNLKTWDMLTRKGKEPYTRMYLFFYNINDDGQDNLKKYFNQSYVLPKIKLLTLKPEPNTPTKQQNLELASVQANETEINAPIFDSSANMDIDLSELEHVIIPYDITSVSENDHFDTFELTERLKEVLKSNRISQEIFCRAVLNLTDRILCKPKAWPVLGKKAREHFIRIHLFLNDPFKFEKLNDWKEKHFSEYISYF